MKKILLLMSAAAMLLAVSCTKEEEHKEDPKDPPTLYSFSFTKELNPSLTETMSAGDISSHNIVMNLPTGTDPAVLKSLIPSFTATNGAVLKINGNVITSGMTPINVSDPIDMLLSLSDQLNTSYTLTVKFRRLPESLDS